MKNRSVMIGLVAVQVFFATLPIAAKIALREFSSPALALLRCAVAAVLFLAIHRVMVREKIRSRADYLRLAYYSVLGVSLNQLLYITALTMTTATAAQMLVAGGPAVTLMVAILAGRESGSRMKWVGVSLAGIGVLVLVATGESGHMLGNTLVVINMIAYSMYLVLARGILKSYHPLTVVTWIFIFGVIGLAPFGLMPAIHEWPATSLQTRLALLWIIIFPTVLAYYLNVWALTVVESSLVSAFVYLQPVMTALLAMSILGERPGLRMIPAALFIFAGVAVAIRAGRSPDHQPHPEDQAVVET